MNVLIDTIEQANTIAIAGHIRPDGDSVGSCLGVYNYILDNYPEKTVHVYLEQPDEKFAYLNGYDEIKTSVGDMTEYDAFISLDCATRDRFEPFDVLFEQAKEQVNVDHHISNSMFCKNSIVDGGVSAAAELIYELLEDDKISKACAECLYTGIIHDTGVFIQSNTKPATMRIAANLMEKEIPFVKIIEDSFYSKSYKQNTILGYALAESVRMLNDKVIYSFISKKWLDLYEVSHTDLDGIVAQLRMTKGVEVAIFAYELQPNEIKVSLRSNGDVNVNRIASVFGGGGHEKASGCKIHGDIRDVINGLLPYIEKQLEVQ